VFERPSGINKKETFAIQIKKFVHALNLESDKYSTQSGKSDVTKHFPGPADYGEYDFLAQRCSHTEGSTRKYSEQFRKHRLIYFLCSNEFAACQ
jgi:hypothetical protein